MWGAAIGTTSLAGTSQFGSYAVNMLMDAVGFGAGARSYADGVNTGGSFYVPEVTLPNVETYELGLPILYLFRREATDSGGPGKWRGGAPVEYALTLHDAPQGKLQVSHAAWGTRAPVTSGLFGGYPAANLWLAILRDTDIQTRLQEGTVPSTPQSLKGRLEIPRGNGATMIGTQDVLWLTSYGGGYGDPLDRDPELVCRDVADRLVSIEAARKVYGVVLAPPFPSGGGLAVGYKRTEAKRAQIKRKRLEVKATPRVAGAPSLRIHEYLGIQYNSDSQPIIACRKCSYVFGAATENYKDYAVARRQLPSAAGPRHRCQGQFIMREFYCPGCATLLDVEICVEGAPFVWNTSVREFTVLLKE